MKKAAAPKVVQRKPRKASECPRAHFHRPGTYCKACLSVPKERGV